MLKVNRYLQNLRDLGYLVLTDTVLLEGAEQYFDQICTAELGYSLSTPPADGRLPLITMPLEKNRWFLEWLGSNGLANSINAIFPNSEFYFWGSDFSTFAGSSSWHRDVATRFPIYKCLIYLEGSYGEEQSFHLIPGSNHVGDDFSKRIAQRFGWPKAGGYDNQGFVNTINIQASVGTSTVPSHKINICRGDVIIFDQRVWHTVFSKNRRRLITLSFLPREEVGSSYWSGDIAFDIQKYIDHILEARTAARFLEKSRLQSYRSSHRDFGLEQTWIAPYLLFDQYSENWFEERERCLFSGQDAESTAWSYLNVTG
jgi:hypothetical protein